MAETAEGIPLSGSERAGKLKKAIRLRHAVALYVSSVLGSGVLVLPGLAAQLAGPASLIAWLILSLASYPFAYTFASLSSRNPESGGIYAFAKESFGLPAAVVTGWLFAFWYITGGPAATLIAASYLAYAFPMSRLGIYLVAGSVTLLAFVVNYRGIVFSNRIQLGVVVAIVGLLVSAVALSIGSIEVQNFSPFFSNGLLPQRQRSFFGRSLGTRMSPTSPKNSKIQSAIFNEA
ncbi:MAG: amino acid permease [Ignavibacteriales bacterium]|nr:amino acid permease [Ignavibacteriales bacterium]